MKDITEAVEEAVSTALSGDDLGRLTDLIEAAETMEERVRHADEALQARKNKLNSLLHDTIPHYMDELGVTSFETRHGTAVSVDTVYGATLSKGRDEEEALHAARFDRALRWLRDNGHDGIIQNVVSVEFAANDDLYAAGLYSELASRGLAPAQKTTVHPATLKAFIKEQTEAGNEIPEDLFRVNIHRFAKVRG